MSRAQNKHALPGPAREGTHPAVKQAWTKQPHDTLRAAQGGAKPAIKGESLVKRTLGPIDKA